MTRPGVCLLRLPETKGPEAGMDVSRNTGGATGSQTLCTEAFVSDGGAALYVPNSYCRDWDRHGTEVEWEIFRFNPARVLAHDSSTALSQPDGIPAR